MPLPPVSAPGAIGSLEHDAKVYFEWDRLKIVGGRRRRCQVCLFECAIRVVQPDRGRLPLGFRAHNNIYVFISKVDLAVVMAIDIVCRF